MKSDFLATLISFIVAFEVASSSVSGESIFCEKTEVLDWSSGKLKTCYMKRKIKIDSEAFKIAPADPSIQAINFSFNRKVSFLPIGVDETYLSLVGFSAPSCSIKRISKNNFKNMRKLKELYLDHNQIEKIYSNTFEDLVSLDILGLGFNIIKQMNGALFSKLQTLQDISLAGNTNCVNIWYKHPDEIAGLSQKVEENCGFAEINEIFDQLSSLETENAKLRTELEAALSKQTD